MLGVHLIFGLRNLLNKNKIPSEKHRSIFNPHVLLMGTCRPREEKVAAPGLPESWWSGLDRTRGLSFPGQGAANIPGGFSPVMGL